MAEGKDYLKNVQALLPHLQLLDNKRLAGSVRRTRNTSEVVSVVADASKKIQADNTAGRVPAARSDGRPSLPELQPGGEGPGDGRGGGGHTVVEGHKKDRQESGAVADLLQSGGKKHKRKRRVEAQTDAAGGGGSVTDVAGEERAQEHTKPKKKRKENAASVKVSEEVPEGPAAAPKGKQKKRKKSSGGVGEVAGLFDFKSSEAADGAGKPEGGLIESGLQRVGELKAGMRGAQVGAALQHVLGNLDSERPLAPGWD